MELRDYIRLVTRSWALLVGLAVLGAVVGGAVTALRPPAYQATAKAFVSSPSGQSLADLSAGTGFLTVALKGYADIATTSYVLKPVIEGEGLDTTPAELAQRVQVTAGDQESVLSITAEDTDPARAASTANAVTAQLADAVVALTPAGTTRADGGVLELTVIDPAVAPTSRIGLSPAAAAAIGALVGIVLAVLVALLRELLDTRVRGANDLRGTVGVTTLGTTRRDRAFDQHPLVVRDAPSTAEAGDFRAVRAELGFALRGTAERSIVVAAAGSGEGASTVSANLALALAKLGDRVVLVDADLRSPSLATTFGADGTTGLTAVLRGDATIPEVVRPVGGGLDLLPAGLPDEGELLQSPAAARLIADLQERYDVVVIDAPPVLASADAAMLGARASGVVLVAAAGRTRRDQVDSALAALGRADARVIGTVLTMAAPATTRPRRDESAPIPAPAALPAVEASRVDEGQKA